MLKERSAVITPPGLFGTALAVPLSENVERVTLIFRFLNQSKVFQESRENREKFPGIILPDNVYGTDDFEQVLSDAGVIVLTPTSRFLRDFYSKIYHFIRPDALIVCGTKGFEEETNLRPSQVLKDINPKLQNLAILSGPNYADEVIRGLPTATVIASEYDDVALKAYQVFKTKRFRPYMTDDIVGVELSGALKNLIAMAVGIADGMEMGSNGAAALMNRGIKEATRLAVVLGADERTMAGLAGAADVVVSSKRPGRNYIAGYEIGQGANPQSLRESGKTIEGLYSIKSAIALADKFGVEIPILQTLYEIICKELRPYEAINRLMDRDGYLYEDPQPIINKRLKFPLRLLNRVLHPWGRIV